MSDDQRLIAFPPILPKAPHSLILGTMPGGKSLEKQQYYAHPQNQFWRFMGDIYGALPAFPYEQRVEILKENGVAVWDVLSSCTRIGSMDADIKNAVVNDFEKFYNDHPTIKLVVFDSLTAENYYLKQALPTLKTPHALSLMYKRVPSPSPAYARMSYSQKLLMWTDVLKPRDLLNTEK